MTALILHSTPFVELVVLKLQAIGQRIVSALDAFAEAKMQNAVPEYELRRSEREINRYCQIMEHAAPQAGAGRKARRLAVRSK